MHADISLILNIIAVFGVVAVVLILAKLNISQKEIKERIDAQKEFLHGSIDEINSKLIETAMENQKQIEKNNELFNKIYSLQNELKIDVKNSLIEFNKELSGYLADRFDSLGRILNERLDATTSKVDKRLEESIDKIVLSFDKQKEQIKKDFNDFMLSVENRLDKISGKVDERLKEGFENVDKTFRDIVEGIAKISEAQRKIEQLSGEVVSLQNVLSDKKTRGVFGEIQLENILKSVFGESRELYDLQYVFDVDGKRVIADAVIKAPQLGFVAIDSKFPLENYIKMVEAGINEKQKYSSAFNQNLKKHIDDISDKYIIKGKTADMAIMFLPAEAIFAQINAYHQGVIDYAYKKNVWMASPTTLMALLTTIQAIVRDIKTQKQAKKIQEELIKLSKNFSLYRDRWEKFIKNIDGVSAEAKKIHITTQKISNAFERIEKVDFDKEKLEN
jgi:DNA recombination protein RmuC